MKDKDLLVERVSKKTNIKEEDMRSFIQTVAKVTNQTLDQRKIDKLVKIMKNKDVLNDVEKMI